MSDLPNWMTTIIFVVGSWAPPAIILLYVRGKKDNDVENFIKKVQEVERTLEKLTDGDTDGAVSAIQQDSRLDRLEAESRLFAKMRDDFIAFKARIELVTQQLEGGVLSLNRSITHLNRMVSRLASMDTTKMVQFPPDNRN